MTCDKCVCGEGLERLAEAVSILLEHAGPRAIPATVEELAAANRAVGDALTLLVKGEGT